MKKHKLFSLRRKKGQTLVETALLLPIFILILAGILDFGWILGNQLMVSNGSRDGARYAIVNSEAANLQTLVTTRVRSNPGLASTTDVTVTVTKSTDQLDLTVTVNKKVRVLTPLAGAFLGGQEIILTSSTVMRVE